jgi:transcription initiation factor TFIIB
MNKTQRILSPEKINKKQSVKNQLWDIYDTDRKQLVIIENENDDSVSSFHIHDPQSILQYEELDLCKSCQYPMIVADHEFPTCSKCGTIASTTLDFSPEWHYYTADDKNSANPTRCGNPINPLLAESSVGCKVLCANNASPEMRIIRRWTEWQSIPHKEKSLYDEFQYITIIALNAGIPKMFIEHAMTIHKSISTQKMFRGLNRDGIKAASIYISCRLNGCPRTSHEIAEIFNLDKTSATNGCSIAVHILHNIERNGDSNGIYTGGGSLLTTKPSAFVERFCSRLNMELELILFVKFIAKKVEEERLINDNTPHSVAAGILYFVSNYCRLNITKLEIKTICGVSEVTINKCCKKLEKLQDQFIPSMITLKYRERN